MIYLNNAATSYPKPPSVLTAVAEAMQAMPASALRSSLSAGDDMSGHLRQELAALFHVSHPERIFFTSGATDALNRLIGGLPIRQAIITTDNHNSVLRPAENLPGERVITYEDSPLRPDLPKSPASWLILPHCSNVTGEIHDIGAICASAHRLGMRVLLDASQSAGCIPIDGDNWELDAIAFTGHKALFGPQGTGGFYIRPGITLRPTLFGGTGRDSRIIRYDDGDWEYEVGTPNTPGLAGLLAGVAYVRQEGVEKIFCQLQAHTDWLIHELAAIPHVRLYSPGGPAQGPVVSFNIEGLHAADVGYILQNAYGITTRTGLHCAPLIHRQLHTEPWGTVRASLSYLTPPTHLQALVSAVREIAKK